MVIILSESEIAFQKMILICLIKVITLLFYGLFKCKLSIDFSDRQTDRQTDMSLLKDSSHYVGWGLIIKKEYNTIVNWVIKIVKYGKMIDC